MRVLFLIFIFACSNPCFSQQWTWDNYTPVRGARFEKDAFNHIYSFSTYDTCFYKLSFNGQMLWQVNLPNKFRIMSLTCSPDSSVYVLGTISGTVNISGHIAISQGDIDFCIAKFSPNGNLLWLASGGSKGKETAGDICMHGTNPIIIGTVMDTLHFQAASYPKDTLKEIFIARFFSTGQLDTCVIAKWHYYSIYPNCEGRELQVDHAGNIYGLIYFHGSIVLNNHDTISESVSNSLLKFNASLTYQSYVSLANYWSYYVADIRFNSQDELYYIRRDYGSHGPGSCYINKLTNFTATPVCLTNMYESLPAIDLDSCDNVYFVSSEENYHGYTQPPPVLKYWNHVGMLSPSGNLNWIRTDTSLNPISGTDLVVMGLNNCYVSVSFKNSIQLISNYQSTSYYNYVHAIIQTTFGIPTNITPPPYYVCAGKTMSLTCTTGGAVHWYNSMTSTNPLFIGSTFTIIPPGTGTYTYFSEARTCTTVSGRLPVTFSVVSNPTISISDATVCAGDNFVLSPSPLLTYSFSSGSPVIAPLVNKTYTIYGTDNNGCLDSATCIVSVKPAPSIFIQPSQNPACLGAPVTLSLNGAQSYSIGNAQVSNFHTFIPMQQTIMMVSATASNNCSSIVMYTQKVGDCTGLADEHPDKKFTVYPNPTSGILNIQVEPPASVQIINCVGQTVITAELIDKSKQVIISQLPQGVYFIKCKSGGESFLQKIVLEK